MHTPRPRIQFLFRIHFLLTLASFFLYFGFGFFLGPDFFLSDIGKKFHAIGADIIAVTATVLGPPEKPLVSATPLCVSGASRVLIDWGNDPATTTWDIDRDGSPLLTGLSSSQYSDIAVSNLTSYSYVVTANGPMAPGIAISDPVSATTLDCTIIIPPMVLVTRFDRNDISQSRTRLSSSDRTPTFVGMTNIPNAIIDISLHSTIELSARIFANENGYWEWTPPVKLSRETHLFSITATDPLDVSRVATDSFEFEVSEVTSDQRDEKKSISAEQTISRQEPLSGETKPIFPFDFSVSWNQEQPVFSQGDTEGVLRVDLRDIRLGNSDPSDVVFSFTILDPSGQEISFLGSEARPFRGDSFERHIPIPLFYEPGKGYRVRVDAQQGKYLLSRYIVFEVTPLPLVELGSGGIITYSEAGGLLSWWLLFLMTLFLLWLSLFFREYWFFVHSVRRVTEQHFERLGFFGTRKGVLE